MNDPDQYLLKDGPAAILRRMADTLEKNNNAFFGGLAVIIPPQGGEAIEVMILDPATNLPQFWSLIQTRMQLSIKALDEPQRGWTGR